ncbi:MAG: hypothetical protein OXG64_05990 [Chloroflexi bacterium]|nr:hypothetical protein [Chloroflexota bacterium]
MTIDAAVLPGLLLLAVELLALAAVGFVVVRVALRQADDCLALAHGLVVGPALWGLCVSLILYLLPGRTGALLGWAITLAIGAILIWRAPQVLRVPPRTLAGFIAVTLALFWITLAARQLMKIPDSELHLSLTAYITNGGWPPIASWNPDLVLHYHHGVDLLVALLAPPSGPNPAFMFELIGAYVWCSFALVVATAVRHRGGWLSVLTLSPLLLTAGAWTLVGFIEKIPNVLQIPVPTEIPAAGLGDSLASLYWPEQVSLPWTSERDGYPANIWKPSFVLAYTLAFIVLWHAAAGRRASRLIAPTLGALTGFLGVASAEIALLILGFWIGLEAIHIAQLPRNRRTAAEALRRGLTGPALAVLLLALGGGALTAMLTGAPRGDVSLSWISDPSSRQAWGRFDLLPGGLGLLGIGAIATAALALVVAWRDRLVLALAASSLACMAGALTVQYQASQFDVTRLDGHARNFALLALLVALASRLPALRLRWRAGVCVLIAVLVVWPTVALPARTVALGVSRGVELANTQPGVRDTDTNPYHFDLRRFVIDTPISAGVIRHIRNHTPVDTRVFSPHPIAMSIATGRPNASGFAGHLHLNLHTGPRYEDVVRYLEPGATRRLGFTYVHATNAWVATLPDRAQRWLDDPRLFELLVQGHADALYRVQPAFLSLDVSPNPASFEALRQAIPATATVYLAPGLPPQDGARLAVALSHTQLLGAVDVVRDHLMTDIPIGSVGAQTPDFVAMRARLAPSSLPATTRQPIWWTPEFAVYAPSGAVAPLMPPPPPDFSIQLSNVQLTDGRLAFTATFTDRAPTRWQGQDWVVVATDSSPWRLPYRFDTMKLTQVFVRWFEGQVQPVPETATQEYFFLYEFDPRTGTLAVWNGHEFASLGPPQPALGRGNWLLAARPNINGHEVGLIPVLHFSLTADADISLNAHEGSLSALLVR